VSDLNTYCAISLLYIHQENELRSQELKEAPEDLVLTIARRLGMGHMAVNVVLYSRGVNMSISGTMSWFWKDINAKLKEHKILRNVGT
jgi:hypothetical protein